MSVDVAHELGSIRGSDTVCIQPQIAHLFVDAAFFCARASFSRSSSRECRIRGRSEPARSIRASASGSIALPWERHGEPMGVAQWLTATLNGSPLAHQDTRLVSQEAPQPAKAASPSTRMFARGSKGKRTKVKKLLQQRWQSPGGGTPTRRLASASPRGQIG